MKRLDVPLPHETGFNAADDPYTESEFLKICEDYRVPNDPMRYRDKKFYWTYQSSVGWPDDYIGPDSVTRWIIKTSVGFTDVGLLTLSHLGGGGGFHPWETLLNNSKTAQDIKMKFFKFNPTLIRIILHIMTILINFGCSHGNLLL